MSMLGSQADRLRLTADVISERGVSSGDLAIIEIRLREAADTIISLRDRLQAVQGVGDETNYDKLFGTPERAARTLTNVCQFTHGGELCDRCQCYLFDECNRKLRLMSERSIYHAMLEWLRGDA